MRFDPILLLVTLFAGSLQCAVAQSTQQQPAKANTETLNAANPFPEILLKPYHADYVFYLGSREVGSASRQLVQKDNQSYELHFSSQGSYLLMSYQAEQFSAFDINQNKVRFNHFSLFEKRPFKGAVKTDIKIDWAKGGLELGSFGDKKWRQQHQLPVYDQLTHVLQIRADLINEKTPSEYPVTRKGETKTYRYKVISHAKVNMFGKQYHTAKIKRIRDNNKRETFTWLDKDNHYFPVRILQKKDGDVQFDIRLKAFKYST